MWRHRLRCFTGSRRCRNVTEVCSRWRRVILPCFTFETEDEDDSWEDAQTTNDDVEEDEGPEDDDLEVYPKYKELPLEYTIYATEDSDVQAKEQYLNDDDDFDADDQEYEYNEYEYDASCSSLDDNYDTVSLMPLSTSSSSSSLATSSVSSSSECLLTDVYEELSALRRLGPMEDGDEQYYEYYPPRIYRYGGRCLSIHAMQSLYDLRENNQLCDAVLRMEDGGIFPVHRAILSACSSYFRALFTTILHPRAKTDISLRGVCTETMSALLEWAYLRYICINEDNVCQLLITADYLCVVGVLKMCCDFLISILTPENCFGILRFARKYFCFRLERETHRFIMRNFVEIAVCSDELLDLTLEELKEIIANDELNVKSEEVVWDCVLRWIYADSEGRRCHLVHLMRNIRLGLIDTQFFLENVKDHPYVNGNEECRPVIIETLKFLYDLEMITQKDGEVTTPEIARPRVPHEILFAIGGWSGGSPTNFMETYDTRADRWVKVEQVDPMGPRAYHGTAVVGFSIYIVGGFDGMDYFNSCRCFNAVTKTWKEIAPMNARRCYVSVTVHGDLVYAMGGYDGHHRQNTAERYNYKNNQWSLIAPMNIQRSDASATTLNDKIYITGGFNGQECMNSAEVYDPDSNQWTVIQSMRSRRSGVSCVAYHGFVYVIALPYGEKQEQSQSQLCPRVVKTSPENLGREKEFIEPAERVWKNGL